MISVVIGRRSVHTGDDLKGQGRRWQSPDDARLGEVVLLAVEQDALAHVVGGGTWLVQALHEGATTETPGWGLEVDESVGGRQDLALIDVHRDTRQATRRRGGQAWTETLGDGEESFTVHPMMSEQELRRPLADVVRPGRGRCPGVCCRVEEEGAAP